MVLPKHLTGFLMVNNHICLNSEMFTGSPILQRIKLRRGFIHEGGHYKWRKDQKEWIYNRRSPEDWNMPEEENNTVQQENNTCITELQL